MRTSFLRLSSIILVASAAVVPACGGGGADGGSDSTFSGGSGGDAGSSMAGSGGSSAGGSSGTGGGGGTIMVNTDGGGGTGATTIDPDAGCAGDKRKGERLPANLYFVIDRSGSMNCNLPEDGQSTANCAANPRKLNALLPSKWELTRTALKDAVAELRMTQPDSSAGIVMFPTNDLCDVKNAPDVTVAPLDTGHEMGIGAFLDTVTPDGRTPIAGATILAYDYLHTQLNVVGNKFVVLLTDGAETCKEEELPKLLNEDVPNARLVNIRTFVIGVPGSEDARALLSQIAWAGGTATDANCTHDPAPANVGDCHFDMTTTQDFATDLANALDSISGTVLTCDFDIPEPDPGKQVDLNRVSVTVNGDEIFKDTSDCGTADGWQFQPLPNGEQKIVLCGPACDTAKRPNSEVQIVLDCPPKIPL